MSSPSPPPAYLFHIVSNPPFLDGNKRTGFIAALTFLATNGVAIPPPTSWLYDATIAVAEGRLGKDGVGRPPPASLKPR
jgi:death on curing protein